MFWNRKEVQKLNRENDRMADKIDSLTHELEKMQTFYEETKESEIVRLNNIVASLSADNTKLLNAKEAARQELQWEFDKRINNIEDDYSTKLRIEIESNSKRAELMESQVSIEIENRTKEAIGETKAENKALKKEAKHSEELMNIYKKKFEWGKIELGADEIKWMLLSANPNWANIIDRMGTMK